MGKNILTQQRGDMASDSQRTDELICESLKGDTQSEIDLILNNHNKLVARVRESLTAVKQFEADTILPGD